jgi:DHA1 family bicyclomycin/chloramphenicol resistance-like MFS transporter
MSFAMVQDLFEGDDARSKRSFVTVIFGAIPMVAPATGSLLIHWFGWRSVHWVLALGGALLLIITSFGVAESKAANGTTPPQANQNVAKLLWRDSGFVRVALANALSYGAIFAYIAGSPVVIIGQMGLSSVVFAAVFAATAAALTAGAWTSGLLSRTGVGAQALLNRSLTLAAVATVILAAVTLLGVTSGIVLIPLLLFTLYARGIIAPNLQHIAIERQRAHAGVASAAVGVSQLLAGALASAVVAFLLQSFGPSSVAVIMALLAGGALVTWQCISL